MPEQNKQFSNRRNLPASIGEDEQERQGSQRRSQADQERDRAVYEYLLRCLTDLGLDAMKHTAKPNESSIANQWGQKNNRIFIRRVLRSVLPEYYTDEKPSEQPVPGLTLGKLAEILQGIQEYRAKKTTDTPEGKIPKILTRAEKLRAFYKFAQLSVDERTKLQLPVRSGDRLMQQLIENITDPAKGLGNDDITRFYKSALDIYQSFRSSQNRDCQRFDPESIQESIECLILRNVRSLIDEYFYDCLDQKQKDEIIKDFVIKVERENSRVKFQCGLSQSGLSVVGECNEDTFGHCLPPVFVDHLTRSVVENKILTDEFPVYLNYFTVEKIPPLPLGIKTEEQQFGHLNSILLEEDSANEKVNREDIDWLQKQFAYKVTVHFHVKIPDNYQPKFPNLFPVNEDGSIRRKLEFFEEVTGVGSLISHITEAINSGLLWGIPILQKQGYLPIVHEILHINEIAGQSGYSPVWAHILVNLCKKSDVEMAIREGKAYDQVTANYELTYGEFCGFDLIEISAKAALNARLRAIKQAGIDPETYLTDLCHRIEELNALRHAENLLEFYPFSLRAMEAHLGQTIFANGRYCARDNQFNFTESDPINPWSFVAYEAHLALTKAYLMEGLYRIGKKYLDVIKAHVEAGFLDDLLLAKYELCRFRYHNLTDLEDRDYQHPDRYSAVQAADEALQRAKDHLENHLAKYYKVGEFSQTNFHPFFFLLCRIYAHRAKLQIFATNYYRSGDRWSTLLSPIRHLEKARIYAAQDGEPAEYSYWSAYQSWCYLMLAYLGDNLKPTQPISFQECLDWAKHLVNHALICYSSIGQKCYQSIKDNGGQITDLVRHESLENSGVPNLQADAIVRSDYKKYYETYGQLQIQIIPLIEELRDWGHQDELHQEYDPYRRVLTLDMSILKQVRMTKENPKQQIYLFGTHSALLFFAMGMLELCEEQRSESELAARIEQAQRMFTYCWATAQSGVAVRSDDKGEFIDRNFGGSDRDKSGDSLVQGLYPHRITQFADLGKIFAAVCKVILLFNQPEWSIQDWQEIQTLLDALHTGPHSSQKTSLYQERYNGHLSNHFGKIRQYFKRIEENPHYSKSMIENRNRIVRDVFRFILGDSE
jgi:hypothetical protein